MKWKDKLCELFCGPTLNYEMIINMIARIIIIIMISIVMKLIMITIITIIMITNQVK